jgi:drug/metabolite transporter (DMT)-like permease
MLVLLTMIWGMTFPATKAALEVTDPIHFLALRFDAGLLLLLLLRAAGLLRRPARSPATTVTPEGPSPVPTPLPDEGPGGLWEKLRRGPLASVPLRGLLVGLFLGAGFLLQVKGLEYTTAQRSGFFTGLLVVLVPPLALLARTSRSPLASWLALAPAVGGVYLMADPTLGGLNRGDLYTIGCALAFASQMVVLEALTRNRREAIPLTIAQVAAIAATMTFASLLGGEPLRLTWTGVAAVGYTALFGTVAAVWMQTRFQPEVPAGHAALVFTLEPVFAAVFAAMVLGETMTTRSLAGAALILAAMGLSSLAVAGAGLRRWRRSRRSS